MIFTFGKSNRLNLDNLLHFLMLKFYLINKACVFILENEVNQSILSNTL